MTEATLLLRQIHPAFVNQGRPTSAAFHPTPKDNYELSAYDGDMITPVEAYAHYRGMNLESVGVMAVAVSECVALDLPVRPDPEPFPEHVVIEFQGLSGNQRKKKGMKLRDLAIQRGWVYQAE